MKITDSQARTLIVNSDKSNKIGFLKHLLLIDLVLMNINQNLYLDIKVKNDHCN